jgi:hypothetical protein
MSPPDTGGMPSSTRCPSFAQRTQIRQPGSPTIAGFDNLETAFQYQLLKDPAHETAMLLGLVVEWGGTGAIHSGIAEPLSTLTPTFSFGQG